jgi:hypothetical protein
MSTIRRDLIGAALSRAFALLDYNTRNDFHKGYEFMFLLIILLQKKKKLKQLG